MAKGRKTGGRKAGTPNKSKTDVAEVCRGIVSDPKYLAYLAHRIYTGQAPAPIESMIWHYAHGKPTEALELSGTNGEPIVLKWK